MSSKNNDTNSAAALMGAGLLIVMMILFALGVFIAGAMTIVCMFAWHRPIKFFGETITPREAHLFVYSGLVGVFLLPAFALCCGVLFHFVVLDDWMGYLLMGGYVLGSFGSWIYMAYEASLAEKAEAERASQPVVLPPSAPVAPQPFQFASWDDEEELP
jgi:hypothetical protein